MFRGRLGNGFVRVVNRTGRVGTLYHGNFHLQRRDSFLQYFTTNVVGFLLALKRVFGVFFRNCVFVVLGKFGRRRVFGSIFLYAMVEVGTPFGLGARGIGRLFMFFPVIHRRLFGLKFSFSICHLNGGSCLVVLLRNFTTSIGVGVHKVGGTLGGTRVVQRRVYTFFRGRGTIDVGYRTLFVFL